MTFSYKYCPVTREKIVDFLLEELSYHETVALDNHLRECESCRATVESYMNLFKEIRSVEALPVSSEVYFNLKQRVLGTGQQKKKRKEPYLQMFSLLLSAAAVLLFITVFSGNVFISDLPKEDLSLNGSWFMDTMFVKVTPAHAPLHDSLVFINNFLSSKQHLTVSMPNILTRFYSFTSDMLAQYAAPNAIIAPKSFDISPLFQKLKKNISNIPGTETQCICFHLYKSELIA